jgi:magnesium transporter
MLNDIHKKGYIKIAKLFSVGTKERGLPPGTLVYTGEKKVEEVRISYIDYDENNFEEKQVSTVEECFPLKETKTVSWVNIDGLHDVEIIKKLSERFGIHPLIQEDIVHVGQRPKCEESENTIFIVFQMLSFNEDSQRIDSEQVSLIFGSNYVLSFQERPGDCFETIRNRIRESKGRIRKMGADYLAYTLVDAVVDNYFFVLEKMSEKIELLQEGLLVNPDTEKLQQIHFIRRELISLRKSVWPMRELVSGLERSESSLIAKTTGVYLRDVYDHSIQVIEAVETFRDMVSSMLDIYLSSVSNRMNEVMKVLTIIATIFIPLTFIAGLYGMNFKNMPELEWKYGYGLVLLVMLVVSVVMLLYFKRKRWL